MLHFILQVKLHYSIINRLLYKIIPKKFKTEIFQRNWQDRLNENTVLIVLRKK